MGKNIPQTLMRTRFGGNQRISVILRLDLIGEALPIQILGKGLLRQVWRCLHTVAGLVAERAQRFFCRMLFECFPFLQHQRRIAVDT